MLYTFIKFHELVFYILNLERTKFHIEINTGENFRHRISGVIVPVLCTSSDEVAIWFWYSAHRLKMLYLCNKFRTILKDF